MRQLLKQRITVNRPAFTQGNNLGVTSTNTAVYTNLPASIQPATSSVQFFYAQRQLKVTQTIVVAGTLSLLKKDTISDGTNSYVVVGWRDLSGRGKYLAIDCELYLG